MKTVHVVVQEFAAYADGWHFETDEDARRHDDALERLLEARDAEWRALAAPPGRREAARFLCVDAFGCNQEPICADRCARIPQPAPAPEDDKIKRPPGCRCHREEGDSECPVHDPATPGDGRERT